MPRPRDPVSRSAGPKQETRISDSESESESCGSPAVYSHWQVPRRPNREPDRGTGIRRLGVWAALATGVLRQCHRASD